MNARAKLLSKHAQDGASRTENAALAAEVAKLLMVPLLAEIDVRVKQAVAQAIAAQTKAT